VTNRQALPQETDLPRSAIEAASWDARLRSPLCSDADRDAFAEWCAADPANARALHQLKSALSGLHEHYASSPQLRGFRDQALAHRPRGRWRAVAAGVLAASVVGLGGLIAWKTMPVGTGVHAPQVSVFQTALRQYSRITLSDGSTITLDSKSRVEVAYTDRERRLRLLAGRARFDVAKDPRRPFEVDAGARRVVAVGTTFDILLGSGGTRVTMLHGQVRTFHLDRNAAVQELGPDLVAGEQLVSSQSAPADKVSEVGPVSADNWATGRILFRDTPLADAIDEVNLYTDKPIVIGDPAIRGKRIGGLFLASAPDQFVDALTQYFSLRIKPDPQAVVLISR
jgi:transmembrane sensor